ncbi:MAG: hypothetical protein JW863_16145 [Chitinispirillaceae bacterium]|nr:hypothetical protein [Chitinispirillaceae bacterium]
MKAADKFLPLLPPPCSPAPATRSAIPSRQEIRQNSTLLTAAENWWQYSLTDIGRPAGTKRSSLVLSIATCI